MRAGAVIRSNTVSQGIPLIHLYNLFENLIGYSYNDFTNTTSNDNFPGPLNTASNGVAIEGGKASVTCNVKFYKHADFPKTPSLIWDIPGADQTSGVGANDVTRTANFTVDSSHDGKSYRCRVYYTSPPPQYTNEKYASITVHCE